MVYTQKNEDDETKFDLGLIVVEYGNLEKAIGKKMKSKESVILAKLIVNRFLVYEDNNIFLLWADKR